MFENSVHYLTFNERGAIESTADEYDSIILPSHLIIGGAKKIPTLLNRLRDDYGTEFYINPAITQLRAGTNQLGDNNQELSEWFRKLVDEHSEVVEDQMHSGFDLKYNDLTHVEVQEICNSVVDLQENFVLNAAREVSGKYETVPDDLGPKCVIPWYKKITSPEDIPINRELIELSQKYASRPCKPCFFLTSEIISDRTNIDSIVEVLEKTRVDEIFLWIEDFGKDETTIREYRDAIELVHKISQNGVNPHFLYGTYFANLLGYFGLRGIGFGVFHSESKSEKLESTGGSGDNLNRYYFNPVKDFLNVTDVDSLTDTVDTPLCQCTACERELDTWDELFRVGDDWNFLREHFISTKRKHKEDIQNRTLQKSLETLKDAEDAYLDSLNQTQSTKTAHHLKKWRKSVIVYIEETLEDDLTSFNSAVVPKK